MCLQWEKSVVAHIHHVFLTVYPAATYEEKLSNFSLLISIVVSFYNLWGLNFIRVEVNFQDVLFF